MSQSDPAPATAANSPVVANGGVQSAPSHRLEDIGLLATRVAHDLNNMLTPMLIAMPILRPSLADPAARSLLDSLETTLVRSTGLVRQVLDYARGQGGQCQTVLMRQLLEEIANFVRETFPRNIRVELQAAPDPWPVNANLSQLYQVLLNLCINARDAMPLGGSLSLRMENCVLDQTAAAALHGARAGSFLVLQVDDTGTGFSPAAMAKIREPFLPARKEGEEAALGLSTIRDIIFAHHGFVRLNTVSGSGSSFRIYLPAERAPATKPGVISPPASRPLVKSHTDA